MDFWSALESLSENEFRAQKSKETTLNYIEWTDNKLFINTIDDALNAADKLLSSI